MSPTASPRLDRRKLLALLEPVVERSGADLEDLTEQRAGSRRLVRVVVDRDGGVSLDDIAEVTRAISEALDASNAMGESAYVLEVTSPGVDRPLTEPRHWRRAVGRLVKAVLKAGGEVTGRVAAADEQGVTLLVNEVEQSLGYAEIARAKMQVEFNRSDADEPSADDDGEFDAADGDDEDDDETGLNGAFDEDAPFEDGDDPARGGATGPGRGDES